MIDLPKLRDMRVKEKFSINDRYYDEYAKICGPIATLAYMSLCRHVNEAQSCFPGQGTMADYLGVSRASINRGLRILKKWNIITIVGTKKEVGGILIKNDYFLNDQSEWLPVSDIKAACSKPVHNQLISGK